MKNKQYTLISIEGNIGSGKSTLLKLMKHNYPNLRFIQEPVNEWQCINGDPKLNLLGKFYEDPKRWAYTMQVYAFYSRLKHWKQELTMNPEESGVILSERSIQADRMIFAVNGHKNGLIDNLEYALYKDFYDWLVEEIFGQRVHQQLIIYLQVDPEICHKRMQKRARDEEKNHISFEYLQQIHDRHEDWLVEKEQAKTKVLILNGDKEFENDKKQQQLMFDQIQEFLKGSV